MIKTNAIIFRHSIFEGYPLLILTTHHS